MITTFRFIREVSLIMNDSDQVNFDEENKKINEFLSYLASLKCSKTELENNSKCKDIIYYLHEIISVPDYLDMVDWNLFIKNKCFNVFPKLIAAFLTHHTTLLELVKTLNAIFNRSIMFCLKFSNSKRGLQSLQTILTHKFTEGTMLVYIIANLNILSRYSEESLFRWKELNIVNKLFECLKRDERLKRAIIQAIINGAQNEDANVINEICAHLGLFQKILEQAYHDYETNSLNRVEKEFFIESSDGVSINKFQVHVINVEYGQMTLTNLLLTIYRFILLCPDQNKKTYIDFKLKDTLKLILFKGNVIEKKFCIKLLGQLMFDFEIRNDFHKESDFLKEISHSLKPGKSKTFFSLPILFMGLFVLSFSFLFFKLPN